MTSDSPVDRPVPDRRGGSGLPVVSPSAPAPAPDPVDRHTEPDVVVRGNYATVDPHDRDLTTVWPVNVGVIEWVLRYGDPTEVRMQAASVVNAYAVLTDPSLSQRDALDKLRRARRASSAARKANVDDR